jgi:hypothetical protein
MGKKKNKDLVHRVAVLISKKLTKADWMASFWDEIDEIKDKDVITERKKLLQLSGEIIRLVRLEIDKENEK